MASQLLERLREDIKTAMKTRERERLTALRSLHAQIKDATVNMGREATDEIVAGVVAKAIKQRNEAVEQYRQGGREELAEKEEREIQWFRAYQPEQLDVAALRDLARRAVEQSGASGRGDLGKVMSILMPQVKGRAEGKAVKEVVQELLDPSGA